MGIWFEPFYADQCCLCGATENLTGEHKIKASALRSQFGSAAMVIGAFDGEQRPRSAQGPKSRAFHFQTRMCSECNGAQTQEADRAFDRFHRRAEAALANGDDPGDAFRDSRYVEGSPAYLNLFRYFAKLLSCHVAESGGPRALQVTDFARGIAHHNPIFLSVDRDPTYAMYAELTGEHAYAAHGGLCVPMDRYTRLPTSFQSALSIGPVRYSFWVRFDSPVGLALRLAHRSFYTKCLIAFDVALRDATAAD